MLIRVDEDELKLIPNAKLHPGMPAQVTIQTIERTALDYLIGPLAMSFNHAFRQRLNLSRFRADGMRMESSCGVARASGVETTPE